MLPLGLALATKVLPAGFGDDSDLARLAAPGRLLERPGPGRGDGRAGAALAGRAATRRVRGGTPLAAVGLTVALTTILLTYSRGGILALAMAVAVTAAFLPRRSAGAVGR